MEIAQEPTNPKPTDPQPTESEPTDPEPIEPKPTTPSNPSTPGTGDYVLPIFLTALLISALGIAAVVVYRRKFN